MLYTKDVSGTFDFTIESRRSVHKRRADIISSYELQAGLITKIGDGQRTEVVSREELAGPLVWKSQVAKLSGAKPCALGTTDSSAPANAHTSSKTPPIKPFEGQTNHLWFGSPNL